MKYYRPEILITIAKTELDCIITGKHEMSCNSCAKSFTLFRKEKGCPGCGFSFCSKCLDNKLFLPKLNAEAKVCAKCKRTPPATETGASEKPVIPPDAYYKRLGLNPVANTNLDQEIANRLQKLKADKEAKAQTLASEEEIAQRLQNIKGEMPKASDEEIQERLARLRGVPVTTVHTQPVLIKPDLRTEQEQADDLLQQYLDKANMDQTYKDGFDAVVTDMESRIRKLKGAEGSSGSSKPPETEIEDEEETVRKIVEKVKAEALDPDELPASTNDELPFCEICNEDAKVRCLGCRYLFCKRCFNEHKDDDDDCNRYEPYSPPKGAQY